MSIGMGCKRGIKPQKIEALIDETLKTAGMKKEQILALASIDKKQDEQGFLIWSRPLPEYTPF
ncbi:MAG: cobalamin biosynthesis protein [Clostridia bacterium]